ncbi:MAG: hypothetical protein J7M34_10625, partial [Anaerolineae bacterium]|nr:hypothetical protein [Anaerolineae bacterium]
MYDSERVAECEHRIAGEIYTSDMAYQHLVALCDECGHRFTGSPGETKAISYLLERMEAYGLDNVHVEDVPLTGWKRGDARLVVLDSGSKIDALALPYSPTSCIEAELVDLGPAVPEMIAARAKEIRGKVVLVSSANPPMYKRPVHRMEKYSRVAQAGAVGFIFVGGEPGQLIQTGSLPAEAPIPGIGISWESGEAIRRMLKGKKTMRVRLTVEGNTHPIIAHNVIGEIAGEQPGPWLVTGAHLDSHD